MKLKTARIAVYACMGAVVLTALLYAATRSNVFIILAFLSLIAEVAIFFLFVRCPHCGRFLDRTGLRSDAERCPFCGKPLND